MEIPHLITEALINGSSIEDLALVVEEQASHESLSADHRQNAIIRGFERAVQHFMEHGSITFDDEARFGAFINRFGLTQDELDANEAFTRLVMACTLRDAAAGHFPARIETGDYDLQLEEGESLVWIFPAVPYFQQQSQTGSGNAAMKFTDGGPLLVTNKRLRMNGEKSVVDIPIPSIEDIMVQEDGIAFTREQNTGLEYFQTGNAWFASRLIQILIEG